MSFKKKYSARNLSIKMLTCFCGLTSLTLAFGTIKLMKLLFYSEWIYGYLNLRNPRVIVELFQDYFVIGGFSIIFCLPLAFAIDYFFIKKVIKA